VLLYDLQITDFIKFYIFLCNAASLSYCTFLSLRNCGLIFSINLIHAIVHIIDIPMTNWTSVNFASKRKHDSQAPSEFKLKKLQ